MKKEQDKSCKTPRWRMLKSQLNNLSAEEFEATAKQLNNAVIIDVRTVNEFELGHMPGAINMDYFSDGFLEEIEQMDKSKDYLIYCRSGRRSIRVCTWMRNGGFDNNKVYNLDKGYGDWLQQFSASEVSKASEN